MQGRGVAPLLCTFTSAKVEQRLFHKIMAPSEKHGEKHAVNFQGKVTVEKKSGHLVSPLLTTLILHPEEKRQNSDLPFWKISVMIFELTSAAIIVFLSADVRKFKWVCFQEGIMWSSVVGPRFVVGKQTLNPI